MHSARIRLALDEKINWSIQSYYGFRIQLTFLDFMTLQFCTGCCTFAFIILLYLLFLEMHWLIGFDVQFYSFKKSAVLFFDLCSRNNGNINFHNFNFLTSQFALCKKFFCILFFHFHCSKTIRFKDSGKSVDGLKTWIAFSRPCLRKSEWLMRPFSTEIRTFMRLHKNFTIRMKWGLCRIGRN